MLKRPKKNEPPQNIEARISRLALRKKWLEKFAQTQTTTTTQPVAPAPPITFIERSPNIIKIFGEAARPFIVQLANYLNQVIHYTSAGQYNMNNMFNNSASINITNIADQDLRKLVEFGKETLINIFQLPFTPNLTRQEIINHIEVLENSQHLNSLSNVNPQGQLAQKIPRANIKEQIRAILAQIKRLIPAQLAQSAR